MRTKGIVLLLMLAGLVGAFAQPTAEKSDVVPANPASQEAGAKADGVSVTMAETESVSVNLGMMNEAMKNEMGRRGPWMSGPAAAADPLGGTLAQQLLATNSQVAQLLATMAASRAPDDIVKSQLQVLHQLLANQAAILQLLTASAGNSVPAGGMGARMGGR